MKLSSLADVAAVPHGGLVSWTRPFPDMTAAIKLSSNALMPFESVSYARYIFENSVSPP